MERLSEQGTFNEQYESHHESKRLTRVLRLWAAAV